MLSNIALLLFFILLLFHRNNPVSVRMILFFFFFINISTDRIEQIKMRSRRRMQFFPKGGFAFI